MSKAKKFIQGILVAIILIIVLVAYMPAITAPVQ